MHKLSFTKMHGCGNDYIYVNTMQQHINNPAALAIRLSDRHKGIGSDGLVLIGDGKVGTTADFSMRIFNADGSEAMMCGNASRCIGRYVYERGLTDKTTIRLATSSGIKMLDLHIESGVVSDVTVDMGKPSLADPRQFIPSKAPSLIERGGGESALFVSMGNPHYVIFTDDVNEVETLGSVLERHEAFPERCNIEFACIETDGTLRLRVWERGSGITMACGTGACATAVAACTTGRTGRRSQIVMDGGTLDIEWRSSDDHVLMTGPADFVFDGEIEI